MTTTLGVDGDTSDRAPAVLGRLLLALQRETDLRDVLGSVDFWAAIGPGGGYVLEWWRGPYAVELHRELVVQLGESESRVLAPEDFQLRTDVAHRDLTHRLFLLIRGVPVEFRSCDAIGLTRAQANRSARMRRVAQGPAPRSRADQGGADQGSSTHAQDAAHDQLDG